MQVPTVVPVLLALLAVVLAVVPLAVDPSPGHLGAVLFILLGLLVYYPLVYRHHRLPYLGNADSNIHVTQCLYHKAYFVGLLSD